MTVFLSLDENIILNIHDGKDRHNILDIVLFSQWTSHLQKLV